MSATEIFEQIQHLPETERNELVERIENEYGDFDDELTLEQIAEFERRGEELRRNPASGIPWETVRAELQERIKSRSCAPK